ncbi:hypothetical protein ACJZ2D_006777 [Fusarium nematophilum]
MLQPRMISGPCCLVPHRFTATDLVAPPAASSPQSRLGGLSLGRHANTSPYSPSPPPRRILLPTAYHITRLPSPIGADTLLLPPPPSQLALMPTAANIRRSLLDIWRREAIRT